MKYNILKLSIYSFAMVALLAGCKNTGSWQTDEATGMKYRFLKHDEKGSMPKMGDVVRVMLVNKTDKDSVLFNSAGKNSRGDRNGDSIGAVRIQLRPLFKGCLEQGITMMSVGDSAEFEVSADSLVEKNSRGQQHPKMPPFLHPGSHLTFQIKLVSFETEQQVNMEREQMMQKRNGELAVRKNQEPMEIAKFLAENKYNVKPTADSLFFLEHGGKGGVAIKDGDSVYVRYKLFMLDGTMVESSDHGPMRDGYPLVYSKHMPVIAGWVEALGMMHSGETAKVLLPSSLAYGDRGAPNSQMIIPYTPIIFDLEVTKVIPAKK